MMSKSTFSLNHLLPCNEVEIHYKRPMLDTKLKLNSSETTNELLRKFIDTNKIDFKEFFWVLLLSNNNQVLGISEIAIGQTMGVSVNIKEIFQLALLANASVIIVAHNHPSGKLEPSKADKNITKKIKSAAKLLDITLLDHLIITSESYASFSDNNWM